MRICNNKRKLKSKLKVWSLLVKKCKLEDLNKSKILFLMQVQINKNQVTSKKMKNNKQKKTITLLLFRAKVSFFRYTKKMIIIVSKLILG